MSELSDRIRRIGRQYHCDSLDYNDLEYSKRVFVGNISAARENVRLQLLLEMIPMLVETLGAIKKHTVHPDNKPSVWNDYLQDMIDKPLAALEERVNELDK